MTVELPEGQRVALVLGARVLPGGVPSEALARRARHAAELWHQGEVATILASGADRWDGPSEAAVIAEVCRDLGVPARAIVLEEKAETTEENLRFAAPLLAAMGADLGGELGAVQVLIVTDRAHGLRAGLVARRQGIAARISSPAPAPMIGKRA